MSPFPFRALASPNLPELQRISGIEGTIAFLDGPASEWTIEDLLAWLDAHLIAPGFMKRPSSVREPGAKPVPLVRGGVAAANLHELLSRARGRVIDAVHGLLAPVPDDRFLNAAIYGGRVRRAVVAGGTMWVPSPREVDFLGEIVLSLFAADVLLDRDVYCARLCICEVCEKLSFNGGPHAPSLCASHGLGAGGAFRLR